MNKLSIFLFLPIILAIFTGSCCNGDKKTPSSTQTTQTSQTTPPGKPKPIKLEVTGQNVDIEVNKTKTFDLTIKNPNKNKKPHEKITLEEIGGAFSLDKNMCKNLAPGKNCKI